MANIILDFDGTLTDIEKEAVPFLQAYARRFSQETRIPLERLNTLAGVIGAEITLDPAQGWISKGCIVAPISANPYVLNAAIHRELITRIRSGRIPNEDYKIPGPEKQEAFGQALFDECYPLADTCFRQGAKEFLDSLVEEHNAVIVTNTKTSRVKNKLAHLGNYNEKIKVLGNAKKFKPTDGPFPKQEAFIHLPRFPRPVFLNRGVYAIALSLLSQEIGFHPENTTVVGDTYELDLALPEKLGYRCILLETKGTQPYERPYIKAQPNLFLAKDFNAILEILKK